MKVASRVRKLLTDACLRDDRGQSLVEFSMVASVLFLTIAGLLKVCLAVYTYHYVSEVSHETSRYAAVRGSNASSPVSTNDTVQTHVRSVAYPGINSSLLTTSTTWDTYPASGNCPASGACNQPGNLVTVTVSYAFPLTLPYSSSKTLTMSSTAAMIIAK